MIEKLPVQAGDQTGETPLRDAKGRFPKGVSGNPNGAPKGQRRSALKEIEEAVEAYKVQNGKSYWAAATEIAMEQAKLGNTTLLGKILDKFVPSILEHIDPEEAPEQLPFYVRGPSAN